MRLRLLPYGDRALLVEPADPADVLPLAALLRDDPDVVDVVPAARTLLVRAADLGGLRARLHDVDRVFRPGVRAARAAAHVGQENPIASAAVVVLDVRYDGPDLADTAAEVGLQADGLVRAHAAGDYVVAFCGFAPGFAYLAGLDSALHVPRLAEPRTRVPAGSVGIAGEFTGVYPHASPGGWRLLGRTDAVLWDVERNPPALLPPGTQVRFRPA